MVTESPRGDTALRVLIHLGLQIGDVNRSSVEDGAAAWRPPSNGAGLADVEGRNRRLVRHDAQHIRVDPEDGDINAITEPSGAIRDHVEYGLQVGWGATDDFEDFARGRLLVLRLRLELQGLRLTLESLL